MKNLFDGYYELSKDEFDTLWTNAIFVFDTNVLLNLYRYQSSTRDSLLDVIEHLVDRVWIPYHVGLEFQRGRLNEIAKQQRRYSEVREIVSKSITQMEHGLSKLQLKKRHSHINPDELINDINEIKDRFFTKLVTLEEQSISVNCVDNIREKIDKLFEGKVGSPPQEQKEIDELFKEGEGRYKKKIPPGFEDANKEKNSPDEYTYGGITYKRKFGDLIVWKQIINQAKKKTLKDVIFITDDNKPDWWWIINNNGKKTIGVRPELADELKREAGVERFHLYNTERFLSYAKELLGAKVTDQAIEEVREVSVIHRVKMDKKRHNHVRLGISTNLSVFKWLKEIFSELEHNQRGFPDLVGYHENNKYGFEVTLVREPRSILGDRFEALIDRSYRTLKVGGFYEISLIFVVLNEDDIIEVEQYVRGRIQPDLGNLKVVIGKAEIDEDKSIVHGFTPYYKETFG